MGTLFSLSYLRHVDQQNTVPPGTERRSFELSVPTFGRGPWKPWSQFSSPELSYNFTFYKKRQDSRWLIICKKIPGQSKGPMGLSFSALHSGMQGYQLVAYPISDNFDQQNQTSYTTVQQVKSVYAWNNLSVCDKSIKLGTYVVQK